MTERLMSYERLRASVEHANSKDPEGDATQGDVMLGFIVDAVNAALEHASRGLDTQASEHVLGLRLTLWGRD